MKAQDLSSRMDKKMPAFTGIVEDKINVFYFTQPSTLKIIYFYRQENIL
jgi:hypothetical protein